MKMKILCTLGPSSLRPNVIRGLDRRGVDLFRINLSHTPVDAIAEHVDLIRRYSATPICLDTEGAQVGRSIKAFERSTLSSLLEADRAPTTRRMAS